MTDRNKPTALTDLVTALAQTPPLPGLTPVSAAGARDGITAAVMMRLLARLLPEHVDESTAESCRDSSLGVAPADMGNRG